jgi:hypothetical protein
VHERVAKVGQPHSAAGHFLQIQLKRVAICERKWSQYLEVTLARLVNLNFAAKCFAEPIF